MKRFRIEHKHSGTVTVVIGHDFYDACRRCGKDPKFWKKIEEFLKKLLTNNQKCDIISIQKQKENT